ncbi:cytochrome P450 [Aspergillus granulosus]|uniref:Cytochrome P450 n=1 Tax=Aspergillus granulosus TaxID=176169 RepID=A0ABR4HD39_9EURO
MDIPVEFFKILHPQTITLLLFTTLLARIIYLISLYPNFLTRVRTIPTPKCRSWTKGSYTEDPMSHIAQLRHWKATVPNRGLIRYYLPGNQERLLVTSIEALNDILVMKAADFGKPVAVRRRLSLIAGNGLLLAEGKAHKAQRKRLMPVFSFRAVKDLYPVFWAKAAEMTNCIERELEVLRGQCHGKDVQEMRKWATRATLDIIGVAALGHDFDSLRNPNNSLLRQYQLMRQEPSRLEIALQSVLSLFTRDADHLVSLLPTKRAKTVGTASKFVRNFCTDLVETKRKTQCPDSTNPATIPSVDIATVALRSSIFTDEQLVDQMMTFVAAGHGTTSHALQWAVYALCKHLKIQERLRTELHEHLTDRAQTVSSSDIDNLPYLHAVCSETIRLYPPVPSTTREAIRSTIVAGYHIPAGIQFTISPAVMNVDTELWGLDAETFNPDRWMGEGCKNTGGVRNHHGFLTFLQGPRSCIGATFAKAELACLLAALVARFRMQLEDPNKEEELIKRGVGSGPADGVRVRFEVVEKRVADGLR